MEFEAGAVFSAQFAGLKTVDLLEYLVQMTVLWMESRCVVWFEISGYMKMYLMCGILVIGHH